MSDGQDYPIEDVTPKRVEQVGSLYTVSGEALLTQQVADLQHDLTLVRDLNAVHVDTIGRLNAQVERLTQELEMYRANCGCETGFDTPGKDHYSAVVSGLQQELADAAEYSLKCDALRWEVEKERDRLQQQVRDLRDGFRRIIADSALAAESEWATRIAYKLLADAALTQSEVKPDAE